MVDIRSLPSYKAGSVPVPYVIDGWDELIQRDTVWEAHAHPTHELLWNLRGASSTTVDSRTWIITPSVGVWIPAGTVHTGRAPAGTRLRAAQFNVDAVPSLADGPAAVTITPLLTQLLERLNDAELSAHSRSLTEKMVLDVLKPSPYELLVHIPQSPMLQQIAQTLDADPGDPRTASEWAETLGISARTLTRAFQAETGLNFTRWQGNLRASHAVMLLSRGISVEEVAEHVGYRSSSAFGAAFRRATGLTPAQFHPSD